MPYRPGSGRKKGGHNSLRNNSEAAELLKLNSLAVVQKAIALATAAEPNTVILAKLIDKVLPTLTVADIDMSAQVKGSLSDIPENKLKDMVVKYAKYAAEAHLQLEKDKSKKNDKSSK